MGFDVNKIIMESLQDVAEKPAAVVTETVVAEKPAVVVTETVVAEKPEVVTVVATPVLEDVVNDKEKTDDSDEIVKSLTESEAIKSAAFAAGLGALNAIKHLRRV